MRRSIGLLAALMVSGCGGSLIAVESATLRYDAPAYAGLERHEVAIVLAPGADERTACIALSCVSDTGSEHRTELCVDTARHAGRACLSPS